MEYYYEVDYDLNQVWVEQQILGLQPEDTLNELGKSVLTGVLKLRLKYYWLKFWQFCLAENQMHDYDHWPGEEWNCKCNQLQNTDVVHHFSVVVLLVTNVHKFAKTIVEARNSLLSFAHYAAKALITDIKNQADYLIRYVDGTSSIHNMFILEIEGCRIFI